MRVRIPATCLILPQRPRYSWNIVNGVKRHKPLWYKFVSTPDFTRFTHLFYIQKTRMPLHTLSEHMSSPSVFSGVRVTRSLALHVCFVDRCLSLCLFSFGHCVVYPSSIYRFWLPLWYLQTLFNFISEKRKEWR